MKLWSLRLSMAYKRRLVFELRNPSETRYVHRLSQTPALAVQFTSGNNMCCKNENEINNTNKSGVICITECHLGAWVNSTDLIEYKSSSANCSSGPSFWSLALCRVLRMRGDWNLSWLLLWVLGETRQSLLVRKILLTRGMEFPNMTGWRYVFLSKGQRGLSGNVPSLWRQIEGIGLP